MNLQTHSTIYAKNQGIDFASVKNETVVVAVDHTRFEKNIVLKLSGSKRMSRADKPKCRALAAYFKVEGAATLFETDQSWSLLFGNEKMVFPSHAGRVYVCATPYYVRDPAAFGNAFRVSYSEHVYAHKNAIVYLDPYDIPSPGGKYFDAQPDDEFHRICYVTAHPEDDEIEKKVVDMKGVHAFPLKTASAVANVSPFVQSVVVNNEVTFADAYYESTNLVQKSRCFDDPDAILMDVLDSYPASRQVGLVIEYPIRVSFVAPETSGNRKFVAFAVNCNPPPKTVLYVPAPYDRYYQYRYPPSDVRWIHLYYDRDAEHFAKPVVVAKSVIGYAYRDTFFCLLYPKLTTLSRNVNTRYLLNPLAFDLESDSDLRVVKSYRFDAAHTLVCVKHKSVHEELWCMKVEKEGSVVSYPCMQSKSGATPSYLVREWGELMVGERNDAETTTTDLSLVKLMFVLDRHDICYFVKEGRRGIRYEKERDIVFYLEPKALAFVNKLRQSEEPVEGGGGEGCVIL